MIYVIVTQEWAAAHGIIPLPTNCKSKDGSKVLLHEEEVKPVAKRNSDGTYDGVLATYDHNAAMKLIDADPEWATGEGETVTASTGFIQAAAVRNLMTVTRATMQTLEMTDNEALQVMDMYPQWDTFIGKELTQGNKVQHGGKLWKALQTHTVQEQWQPGQQGTESLYAEVVETHAGTIGDPIPYNGNMELEQGKYYTQDGATYLCIRGTGIPVYAALAELVGNYVELVTETGNG